MQMYDKIFRVLVPTESQVEYKDGKKKTQQKMIFPGYVLVEMVMQDDSWYVVRNTPGVTGFVGSGTKPVPLSEQEIENVMKDMGIKDKQVRVDFSQGESVKILEGPFENFEGSIEEIYPEKEKLKVLVSMFGRETPVELEFNQVEKMG